MMRNNKKLRFLCLLLLIAFVAGAVPLLAANDDARIEVSMESIRNYVFGEDISAWLAENVGITAEWYVLALARWEKHENFDAYAHALMTYLAEKTVASPVSRQKFALALLASGYDAEYVSQTVEESAEALGVMSRIYALHLAAAGYRPKSMTVDALLSSLFSFRLSDGGFASSGDRADADVTAMVLQALAPYKEREDVSAAISEILTLLRSMQRESGGFMSHGIENAESAAQVILALSALGVENFAEAGFEKNGNTPLDALLSYQFENGAFSHEAGGAENAMATAQAYLALMSLRYGGSPYTLDMTKARTFLEMPEADSEVPASPKETSLKPIVALVILFLGLLICAVLFFLGKRNYKNYLTILAGMLILLALVFILDIQTPEDYYGVNISKENVIGTVTLEIRCDTLADRKESHIPKDGVILPETEFALAEGETVFDILTQAARAYQIQLEYESMNYIEGIAYLYAHAYGDLSGWVYDVNGESPSVGCGAYTLSDGDRIVWYYTLSGNKNMD